jgi:hypothetical protein
MYDPSMNELGSTWTHSNLYIDLSRSLTAHSLKGHTELKIWPLDIIILSVIVLNVIILNVLLNVVAQVQLVGY